MAKLTREERRRMREQSMQRSRSAQIQGELPKPATSSIGSSEASVPQASAVLERRLPAPRAEPAPSPVPEENKEASAPKSRAQPPPPKPAPSKLDELSEFGPSALVPAEEESQQAPQAPKKPAEDPDLDELPELGSSLLQPADEDSQHPPPSAGRPSALSSCSRVQGEEPPETAPESGCYDQTGYVGGNPNEKMDLVTFLRNVWSMNEPIRDRLRMAIKIRDIEARRLASQYDSSQLEDLKKLAKAKEAAKEELEPKDIYLIMLARLDDLILELDRRASKESGVRRLNGNLPERVSSSRPPEQIAKEETVADKASRSPRPKQASIVTRFFRNPVTYAVASLGGFSYALYHTNAFAEVAAGLNILWKDALHQTPADIQPGHVMYAYAGTIAAGLVITGILRRREAGQFAKLLETSDRAAREFKTERDHVLARLAELRKDVPEPERQPNALKKMMIEDEDLYSYLELFYRDPAVWSSLMWDSRLSENPRISANFPTIHKFATKELLHKRFSKLLPFVHHKSALINEMRKMYRSDAIFRRKISELFETDSSGIYTNREMREMVTADLGTDIPESAFAMKEIGDVFSTLIRDDSEMKKIK